MHINKKKKCVFFFRYTIILLIYAFSLLMTVTLRPFVLVWYKAIPGKKAIYCALYFYPILVLTHTVAAGLICEYYYEHY